jgi:hypothetical protein
MSLPMTIKTISNTIDPLTTANHNKNQTPFSYHNPHQTHTLQLSITNNNTPNNKNNKNTKSQ